MIQEAYCSFEVCKLLQNNGFEGNVNAYYHIWDKGNKVCSAQEFSNSEAPHLYIPAPTQQMVMAWIVEKYNVSIEISALKHNCWVYIIYKILDDKVKELYNDGEFKSHEEAVEAALKYTLENLIYSTTQEDKELSFIDISGRLHYGVIVNYKENEYDFRKWKITSLSTLSYSQSGILIDTDYDGWISYEEYEGCGMSTGSRPFRFGKVLPYLRPMSSMTEEEKDTYDALTMCNAPWVVNDWLNAHYFDYRGLIEKGLALEAPEGIYKSAM